MNIKKFVGRILMHTPYRNHHLTKIYKLLGANIDMGGVIFRDVHVKGDPRNIVMHANSKINESCYLLAKERIEIGENSTIAYQVSLFTSASPNIPFNRLKKIYPKVVKPIIIGRDCWIGARATILPGVTIGDYSVVAAGSVVTKDVPSGVLVAGVPAVIKKKLEE